MRTLQAGLATIMVLVAAQLALASDATFGSTNDPIPFTQSDITGKQFWIEDSGSGLGNISLYFKNASGLPWEGIHFEIYGGPATYAVTFDFTIPQSSQPLASWSVVNSGVAPATLDLTFAAILGSSNDIAFIRFTINNTGGQMDYGILAIPAAVPEPAAMMV